MTYRLSAGFVSLAPGLRAGAADGVVGGSPAGVPTARSEASPKQEEFHRRIVEGMTCGVLTIDRSGLITTLNEPARVTLGLDTSNVLGRPCQEVLAHCPRFVKMLLESFRMSSPPTRDEMKIRTGGSDRPRTIGFSISMIGGCGDAGPDGAAIFFKDLTKVEELEERERLRDRLAVLGEMAAQMAHEIRNPLTSIEISATLQKRRLLRSGAPTDLVDRISQEIRRIETTVANCLTYARPLTLERAPIDPARLVEDALLLARQRGSGPGIVVEDSVAPRLHTLECDPTLLREALVNLLVNACEAMHGEGRITLRVWEEDGDTLMLRVSDNGPGISPEIIRRIFHPFFTTKTTGSGIGLATARKVVEAHGGWLDVMSEQGKGATFTMRLPLKQGEEELPSGDEDAA